MTLSRSLALAAALALLALPLHAETTPNAKEAPAVTAATPSMTSETFGDWVVR